MVDSELSTRLFTIIDRDEVFKRRVFYPVALLIMAVVAAGSVIWLVGERHGTAVDILLVGVITALCLALLALFLTKAPRFWRPEAILRMDADGIRLRGSIKSGRDVQVPWPQVTGIGLWRQGARYWQAHSGDFGSPVVSEVIAFDQTYSDVSAVAGRRWYLRPQAQRTLIAVAINAGAPAQADLFATEITELRTATTAAHDRGQQIAADELTSITHDLEQWQKAWSSTPQQFGFFVDVKDDDQVDVPGMRAVLRRFAPGRDFTLLTEITDAMLDTPHDIARLLGDAARGLEPVL